MSFRINGIEVQTNPNLTVGDLLREKNIAVEGVVVEYNREILKREMFDKTQIESGDNIEVLSFVGGG
jgi:sulfur carrier protein